MNKYIKSDINDGLKQMIVGFKNLISGLSNDDETEYILTDIDMSQTDVVNFIWRYIPDIKSFLREDGKQIFHIGNSYISIEQDEHNYNITFKKEKR